MDKRIISLLLSVAVISVLLLVTLPANAEQSNVFLLEAESSTASPRDTITYTLSLSNSKSITAFGFNIVLPDGLAFVESSAVLNTDTFGSTLEIVPNNGYQVLWYSKEGDDFTDTGKVEILQFQCKVDDNADIGKKYEVTLKNVLEAAGSDFSYDDLSLEILVTPHTLSISQTLGYTVNGTITSYLKNEGDITVQLILADETVAYSTFVNTYAGSGTFTSEYSIPEVVDGTYTLRVSKANHVTRDYSVTVSGGELTQDVELMLLGDVHKDGNINAKDILKLRKHFANPSANPFTDYEKQVGNVHIDDAINAKDILKLRKHFANPSSNPLS